MALEAPLRSSTGSILSAFSPLTEFSMSSPESTAPPHSQFRPMSTSFLDSHSLRPSPATRPASTNNLLLSPSDIVGPSPVTSVGTEITEIDDEVSDEVRPQPTTSHPEPQPQLLMLSTNIPDQVRQAVGEESVSVIHAPETFKSWTTSSKGSPKESESTQRMSPRSSSSSPSSKSHDAVASPADNHTSKAPLPIPPQLSTDIKPAKYSIDSATPRAQNLQEVITESSRIRSSSASSLELIPESKEPETDVEPDLESYGDDDDEFVTPIKEQDGGEDVEIKALKTALQECWTLCNTLANLSTHHRERVFSISGTPDGHERAWKCCWKLCQRLYDNRDEADESFSVRQNLDLCRDFCQALFDVRQRKDEGADSVLRVSFELNNHLYSAQDNRILPEAFRERTLDFYITLCHRLMKQRSDHGEETDSLLSACWALAEMLFSLRQSRRDGRPPDAELLGSSIQACWDLCDIFRAGWTQIRPDRGTPRPNQTNFFALAGLGGAGGGAGQTASVVASSVAESSVSVSADGRESRTSSRSVKVGGAGKNSREVKVSRKQPRPPVPETPVTEFEDTPVSPDGDSPLPNILVLGTGTSNTDGSRAGGGGGRWSSSASNLSGYSQSSQRTSSTATTTAAAAAAAAAGTLPGSTSGAEDANVTRVKVLLLKAAMNVGYSRDSSNNDTLPSLQAFVKALPTGSFGSLSAHAALLQNYKALILADPSFRQQQTLPPHGLRVSAVDVAKGVAWMTHYYRHRSGGQQYAFLRDLFKLVFGFHVEEAEGRKSVSIAV